MTHSSNRSRSPARTSSAGSCSSNPTARRSWPAPASSNSNHKPLGVLIGGISLTLQDDDDLPYGQVLIPLGAASIAGGVTMLVIGAKRKQKFDRWHAQHEIAPSFSLLPAGPTRVGVRASDSRVGFE